ncbi:hypothetical protein F5B21DRAFT_498074 [Xylaria acuta]|nr:hypothetical protein F5B21DRAFT_498074 [Xylaria acuta]
MVLGQPWTALWLRLLDHHERRDGLLHARGRARRSSRAGVPGRCTTSCRRRDTSVFDLKSHIGLDFGVLFAWAFVDTAPFPLCCYLMRWRTEHERREASRVKDRYVVHSPADGDHEFPNEGDGRPKMRRGFMRGI